LLPELSVDELEPDFLRPELLTVVFVPPLLSVPDEEELEPPDDELLRFRVDAE
jgi:hypothetical protein